MDDLAIALLMVNLNVSIWVYASAYCKLGECESSLKGWPHPLVVAKDKILKIGATIKQLHLMNYPGKFVSHLFWVTVGPCDLSKNPWPLPFSIKGGRA